jgi:hypothetical protein
MSDDAQHPIWQEASYNQWDEFAAFTAATLVALRSALAVAWDNIPDIIVELERATSNSDLPEDLMMLSPSRTTGSRTRGRNHQASRAHAYKRRPLRCR